ncbi:MAG: type I-F CRISPR-associated helicase Cas3, partial [Algicola sp.]|nr:type I-F CRISPR-associated helicase Cas3 [Algicola sp.]
MNIMLVAQCSKKALPETRRIIDNFAERRGDRTWQTPITKIGLTTLRKLLKKTARRNTAVACHWIRSKNHTELLWVVGNASKFNENGAVPTNITRRDILKAGSENTWHTAEDIALLAGIAALFHDFGKANILFQEKLKPKSKAKLSEPYRHEWVSLRMFEAFVNGETDQQWLARLSQVSKEDNDHILKNLLTDHPDKKLVTPFNPASSKKLPPTARAVAWLILTHHKLPQHHHRDQTNPQLKYAKLFLDRQLSAEWNSPQIFDANEYDETETVKKWSAAELADVWDFANKTPVLSTKWCSKAQSLAKRALNRPGFINKAWLEDTFTLHISRMVLMLADHHYSSLPADERFQDKSYKALANTDRDTGKPKQHLDEHLIGVYRNSLWLVRMLPSLKSGLSAISRHKGLKKRTSHPAFRWQDKAYDVARSISEASEQNGFFGINMASTGKGKTFANARIMYGLSNPKLGCRFSIALGLRTLTLQTGDALQDRLRLEEDDLAVLIGSQAVKQLYDLAQKESTKAKTVCGSESQNQLLDEDQYVKYEGSTDGPLKSWLEKTPKLNKLVNAPVLVSTIDHIMPATESDRGGKQIAPMLRLLTADLVLDEIDDFDLADLPAICRLVNWAGLLGARVLLSSATLPPSLVETLFEAYASGRAAYNKARGEYGQTFQICCAWFDEFNVNAQTVSDKTTLATHHQTFVDKRIKQLLKAEPIRQAALVPVELADADEPVSQKNLRAASALANRVYQSIDTLHQQHAITHSTTGKRLSIGLVRMANINPMVAVAKYLFAKATRPDCQIHYCVYHSRHPLVVRSAIERQLDKALRRDDESAIWQIESVKKALKNSKANNHIFVVLGSPVCEVGRDHDYDWAIIEPSSMRSIIQLAGRIQRHRNKKPQQPNIHILAKNYKALAGKGGVFSCPGFETGEKTMSSNCLDDLLIPAQYQVINAVERIKIPLAGTAPESNLVTFEHQQLDNKLCSGKAPATVWWTKPL